MSGLRERVQRLRDDWAKAGPGTEPDRVFGKQVLSVEWAVRELTRILDADPAASTADAPADTDQPSRERVYHWIKTGQFAFSEFEEWVRAARRDALNEAADAWELHLSTDGILVNSAQFLRDRAASAQPARDQVHDETRQR